MKSSSVSPTLRTSRSFNTDLVTILPFNQVPFSDEQRRKVFGLNALRLFNIDSEGRRVNI